MRWAVALGLVVALLVPLPADAGDLFESWSPVTMAPAGPLTAAAARKLPRHLDVVRRGDSLDITFRPEGRVRWLVTMGRHGPVTKRTEVDGELWTESQFTYTGGKLVKKQVTGPGLQKPVEFSYTHTAKGRVRKAMRDGMSDVFALERTDDGWLGIWRAADRVVRKQTFDAAGRTLTLSTTGGAPIELQFQRKKAGMLRRVSRLIDGKREQATFARPRKARAPAHLREINGAFERHEVLLLVGAPITHSTDSTGVKRTASDNYTEDCWLNDPSGVSYDAADKVSRKEQACICGFCVEASVEPLGDVLGTDEHWTAGPWFEINGVVVTAEHKVATPRGPREARRLEVGDIVYDESRAPVRLHTVRALPNEMRLGKNLRTSSGVFRAGGLLFHAEPPCDQRITQ